MAENGPQYPAELIKSVFDSSDITHISNESTIWSLCPDPRRENRSIQFCSNLNSYDLLDYLGVDVIELTTLIRELKELLPDAEKGEKYRRVLELYRGDLYQTGEIPDPDDVVRKENKN